MSQSDKLQREFSLLHHAPVISSAIASISSDCTGVTAHTNADIGDCSAKDSGVRDYEVRQQYWHYGNSHTLEKSAEQSVMTGEPELKPEQERVLLLHRDLATGLAYVLTLPESRDYGTLQRALGIEIPLADLWAVPGLGFKTVPLCSLRPAEDCTSENSPDLTAGSNDGKSKVSAGARAAPGAASKKARLTDMAAGIWLQDGDQKIPERTAALRELARIVSQINLVMLWQTVWVQLSQGITVPELSAFCFPEKAEETATAAATAAAVGAGAAVADASYLEESTATAQGKDEGIEENSINDGISLKQAFVSCYFAWSTLADRLQLPVVLLLKAWLAQVLFLSEQGETVLSETDDWVRAAAALDQVLPDIKSHNASDAGDCPDNKTKTVGAPASDTFLAVLATSDADERIRRMLLSLEMVPDASLESRIRLLAVEESTELVPVQSGALKPWRQWFSALRMGADALWQHYQCYYLQVVPALFLIKGCGVDPWFVLRPPLVSPEPADSGDKGGSDHESWYKQDNSTTSVTGDGCCLSGDAAEYYMGCALLCALAAFALKEVPVGAVLVGADGLVYQSSCNQSIGLNDIAAHAETLAIGRVNRLMHTAALTVPLTLYVTLEPCYMCLNTAVLARISQVVYGARESRTGACHSAQELGLNMATLWARYHQIKVREGVRPQESTLLLQSFFQARRGNGKDKDKELQQYQQGARAAAWLARRLVGFVPCRYR